MITLENGGPLLSIMGAKNVEKWVQNLSGSDAEYFQRVWKYAQEAFFELGHRLKRDSGRRHLANKLAQLFTWGLSPKGFDHWSDIYENLLKNKLGPEDKRELAGLAQALQGGTRATLEEMI